ncbi:uncharacterized protein J4E87_009202 [Alternaria ethzedia]|uniref:uncharacterized protein n=1 Tax=Alternaria ethzedia TaxID=181014 RepID=UPI0020C53501|nr:uncharacterized protein J4E87_009202 [Alternaria ethzedia]KAI4615309.1 hypothetical protein J4E87_009202 [Alternaria ethzedia]
MEPKIDTRCAWRLGWPRLRSLPLQSLPTTTKHLVAHQPAINKILDTHSVSTLGPVRYVARTRPTELATSHPTIVFYTDLGEPRQYEHCASAVQEIAQYILSNNIDASIEAIDRVVGESFTVTALQGPTAAEIARYWASKRRTLLRTIANRKWLSLDCVNLGKSTDGLKPTIVITASDADADVWDQIIARISVLFDYKLEVELLYGPRSRIDLADAVGDTEEAEMSDISTEVEEEADFASKELKKPKGIANESEDEEFCRPSHFSTDIYPGTSVGVKGGLSESVGGFLKIEFPGLPTPATQVGLTNFHVLWGGDEKPVQPPHLREASCGSVTVVVPSDRDKTRYVRRRKLIINKHNRYLRDASSKHQAVESESHRSKRQQWREEREEERKERKRVEEASNVAGTTWASSAKTSRPHPRYTAKQHENWTEQSRSTNDTTEGPALEWDIDWSLFSIDAPRLAVSKTPRSTDHRHSASDSEISEWGSIQEDRSYEVVKIGRTSGWTRGVVNRAMSILNTSVHAFKEVNNTGGKTDTFKPVLCHSIVSTMRDGAPFISPGDSGSLILLNEERQDNQACIVGLAIGGNKTTNIGYMAPIDLILMDIEEKVQGKVVYPVSVGIKLGADMDS